jgi:phage terminase small subunit
LGKTIPLTPRQEAYAGNIASIEMGKAGGMSTKTQEQAAIDAGYSEKSARISASENMRKYEIRRRIDEIKANGVDAKEITPEFIKMALAGEAIGAKNDGARVAALKTLAQVEAMLIQVKEDRTQSMSDEELIDKAAREANETFGIDIEQAKQALRERLNS